MNNQQIRLLRRLVELGPKNWCSRRNATTVVPSSSGNIFIQSPKKRTRPILRRCISTYDEYDNDDNNNDYFYDDIDRERTALVVGSSGSLGRCLVEYLSTELKVRVVGADVVAPSDDDRLKLEGGFVELPTERTETCDKIKPASLSELTLTLTSGLHHLMENEQKLDAVICVAGAWEEDPKMLHPSPHDDDEDDDGVRRSRLLTNAVEYSENIERMLYMNLYPVLAASYASKHFMSTGCGDDEEDSGGLFVAIGATAALNGTPGMLGYGLSKVATHHFVQTLGETTGKAATTKTKRKRARSLRVGSSSTYLNRLSVIGILPSTIDTPANRRAMPDGDFKGWTKSIDIAKEIGLWMRQPALRPHSGSLIKVHPALREDGAEFIVVR